MNRPRVTASHEIEAFALRDMSGHSETNPGVLVEVSFDLHDHENALRLLDDAVQRVKEQIEEATP